jgi:hypothetical protein
MDTSALEFEQLAALGVWDNLGLLKLWSEATPRVIFPGRQVGALADGSRRASWRSAATRSPTSRTCARSDCASSRAYCSDGSAPRLAAPAWRRGVAPMVIADVALGLMASAGLARFVRSMLYEVAPNDPLTFAGCPWCSARSRCSRRSCRRVAHRASTRSSHCAPSSGRKCAGGQTDCRGRDDAQDDG